MIESSLIVYGKEIVDYQIGNIGSVGFNFIKLWNYYKKNKEHFYFNDLHFFHVHPENMLQESNIDINCMKGFFQAFGKSGYFHIVCFKNDNIFNLDCDVLTLIYKGSEEDIERIHNYNFKYQDERFIIMKLLSYGNFDDK